MLEKCKDFPQDKNVELLINTNVKPPFNINEKIPYKCKNGYILRDSTFVTSKKTPVFTCKIIQNKPKWEMDSACKPVSCGDPGIVENAERKGLLFTFPEKVIFKCHQGYRIRGIDSRYCNVNGEWTPPLKEIKCDLIVGCSYLKAPPNGSVSYTDNQSVGSEIEYKCEKGFQLEGNKIRKCLKNYTWTGFAPKCKKINCISPGPFPNGLIYPKKKNYQVNEHIVYHCPITNKKVIAYCTSHGEWSKAPPLCEKNLPSGQKSFSHSKIIFLTVITAIIVIFLINIITKQ